MGSDCALVWTSVFELPNQEGQTWLLHLGQRINNLHEHAFHRGWMNLHRKNEVLQDQALLHQHPLPQALWKGQWEHHWEEAAVWEFLLPVFGWRPDDQELEQVTWVYKGILNRPNDSSSSCEQAWRSCSQEVLPTDAVGPAVTEKQTAEELPVLSTCYVGGNRLEDMCAAEQRYQNPKTHAKVVPF